MTYEESYKQFRLVFIYNTLNKFFSFRLYIKTIDSNEVIIFEFNCLNASNKSLEDILDYVNKNFIKKINKYYEIAFDYIRMM